MMQHRHYSSASEPDAHIIYTILEREFEEEGFAISLYEVDEAARLWGVSVYVSEQQSADVKSRISVALKDTGFADNFDIEIIPPTNWVAETLRQLGPVRAGRFLVHGTHDAGIARFNDIAINIDASQAFGTGHHATTAGCLEMLGKELKRRKFSKPLDLGTGSGILAIALAKAGKTNVLASDIDPLATTTAHENAHKNGVGSLVTCITATGFNHRQITARAPFDIIIANILARPLQQMAADFSRHLAPGATIILSGLLAKQKARIVSSFAIQKIYFTSAYLHDGWLTLVLHKR